jgi:transcriptional regulator with XRE-family HTH domain
MNIAAAAKEPVETDSYVEIGKLLRAARVQMRMSIDQASHLLHIRVRYLEALEEGRLAELPGLTYTRGYLQSYAAFLDLDKDEILRRFEEMETLLGKRNFYFPQVFSKEKSPDRWAIWGSLGVAVLVYAIWSVFLQPASTRISQVEKMPYLASQFTFSVQILRDVACLQSQDILYPPCTMAKMPFFSMIPMHGQLKSIMDLAITDLAQPEVP